MGFKEYVQFRFQIRCKEKKLVPGTGFEPVTSGHKALAPYKLQIMSLAP